MVASRIKLFYCATTGSHSTPIREWSLNNSFGKGLAIPWIKTPVRADYERGSLALEIGIGDKLRPQIVALPLKSFAVVDIQRSQDEVVAKARYGGTIIQDGK